MVLQNMLHYYLQHEAILAQRLGHRKVNKVQPKGPTTYLNTLLVWEDRQIREPRVQ